MTIQTSCALQALQPVETGLSSLCAGRQPYQLGQRLRKSGDCCFGFRLRLTLVRTCRYEIARSVGMEVCRREDQLSTCLG